MVFRNLCAGSIRKGCRAAAFIARLVNIGETRPFGMGMVQRLIDTPTAIDFSMDMPISVEALREEVAAMAAEVNEEFDALYGEAAEAAGAQLPAQLPASRVRDPSNGISDIKRAMLLQRAQVELVVLRKLSPELVKAAIDRVFPAGMML